MKTVKTSALLMAVLGLLVQCRPVLAMKGMISHWNFDEGEGTMVDDCWGGNDGTIHGAQWTTGVVGSALSFDGVDDYVYVPNDASLSTPASTQKLTIEAWIKINALTGFPGILSKRGPNPYTFDHEYQFCILGGHLNFTFCRWIGDWQNPLFTSDGTDLNEHENEWLHIVVTFDGGDGEYGTVKFYLNGVQDGSELTDPRTGSLQTTSGFLRIGTHPWGDAYFDGLIDEVAVYDHALTSEEIAQHYENGLHGLDYLTIPVGIDIKPGSFPSSINLGKKGVTPVAIHTTDDFDATTVNPMSVEFNGCWSAVDWEAYDCDEIPNPLYGVLPDEPEMIGDGDIDLVLYFDTPALVEDGCLTVDSTEATITGETFDGIPIDGTGDVSIVKGPKK